MIDISDQVSKASKTLILSEAFYGLFLIGLNKKYRMDLPTAGVSKQGIGVQLSINPEFFMGLTIDQRIGLLKHELLHISFGHLIYRDSFEDKKLFNIAADIEINQYIDSIQLPEGGLTLDSFPELNLPSRAGTKVYYDLLKQACKRRQWPTMGIFPYGEGLALYRLERYEEAEAPLREATRLSPAAAENHLYLGHVLSRLKRYDEAVGAYEESTRLASMDARGWKGLGYAHYNARRFLEARIALEKYLAFARDAPDYDSVWRLVQTLPPPE